MSIRFGKLLLDQSNPNSLRIKLHPSCIGRIDDETLEEEEWIDVEGGGYYRPVKMKFGTKLQDDDEDGEQGDGDVWEGEWGDVRLLQ